VIRLVAVIPRIPIDSYSSMSTESGKAGLLITLISDPKSNNKLVFVFKSEEIIRAVGVFGGSFNFTETILRGFLSNLNPILGDSSCVVFLESPFPFGPESLGPLFVSSHDCRMVVL
jgi:hypothetical protein